MSKTFFLTAVTVLFSGLSATGYAQQGPFAKDELVLELTEVSSLIQSSKAEYKDWYLFVAKVANAGISRADGAGEDDLAELIPAGKKVEVMLHKDSCYHEIHAAFIAGQAKVDIQYLKSLYFTETPGDPHHEYFVKAGPVASDIRDRAECIVQR